MERELTFDEIVELARKPAVRVRSELLQELGGALGQLAVHASSVPLKLQNVTRIKDFHEVVEALDSDRTTVSDVLFWTELVDGFSRANQATAPQDVPASAELWQILDVPEATAALYESMGFTPDDYLKCFGTPAMSSGSLMRWASSVIPLQDIRAWVMAGVPDPDVATKWMRELRETPEVVMIQYRHFRGSLFLAKAWRQRAAAQSNPRSTVLTTSPISVQERPAPVSFRSSPVVLATFPSGSVDWLEEIIARAITVQPSIRKVPHWPARIEFNDENLAIQLEQFPRVIKGVVIIGRDRRWCQFDPSTFEISSKCETGEDRYVAGMSICWFIDCSITIHRNPSGSPRLFSAASSGTTRERTPKVRYTPTPTFRERSREVRAAGRGLTIRHKVSGHLRKLPAGQRGSKKARSNAPEHVRRKMLQSETYVEPHFRGTEAEKVELLTRLSRYSALGDAMSELV